eukprot:5498696-Prymnesium_polylepis.2
MRGVEGEVGAATQAAARSMAPLRRALLLHCAPPLKGHSCLFWQLRLAWDLLETAQGTMQSKLDSVLAQ